jgi:hypothetical protein
MRNFRLGIVTGFFAGRRQGPPKRWSDQRYPDGEQKGCRGGQCFHENLLRRVGRVFKIGTQSAFLFLSQDQVLVKPEENSGDLFIKMNSAERIK